MKRRRRGRGRTSPKHSPNLPDLDRQPEYDGSHAGRRKFLSAGLSAEALPLIERSWGDKVPFVQV
jgi:hypothetical protein